MFPMALCSFGMALHHCAQGVFKAVNNVDIDVEPSNIVALLGKCLRKCEGSNRVPWQITQTQAGFMMDHLQVLAIRLFSCPHALHVIWHLRNESLAWWLFGGPSVYRLCLSLALMLCRPLAHFGLSCPPNPLRICVRRNAISVRRSATFSFDPCFPQCPPLLYSLVAPLFSDKPQSVKQVQHGCILPFFCPLLLTVVTPSCP